MVRALLVAVLTVICWAPGAGAEEPAKHAQWRLVAEQVNGKSHRAEDEYGYEPWRFLRTTSSEGPVGARRWIRDGKYVPLDHSSERLFNQPILGSIYQVDPTWKAPFVGGVTATYLGCGRTSGLLSRACKK